MNDRKKPENAAQKGAQKYFTKTGQDETLAKQTRKKMRAADAAKIAKLRALRLAKDAADKEDAAKLAAQKGGIVSSARRKREPAVKPPKMLRMSY